MPSAHAIFTAISLTPKECCTFDENSTIRKATGSTQRAATAIVQLIKNMLIATKIVETIAPIN
ncbi:hypothetical protein SDC9_189924 [bioreactor metagenome]|uniref:Uncharacterized protein n=1 Tax=bioreactor metagenome TaxID=1076179 RepID=A0A645HTS2_9ZZZZ